jgi:beta-ribofuranosylaminobenzene 5'-phosphate synthase
MRSGRPVASDEEVSIRIRPRLHLGLISMHEGGPRRNGGIGFSIQAPEGIVSARPADVFVFSDERERSLAETEVTQLQHVVDKRPS